MIFLHCYQSSNFGDALSPLLVERLSGRPVVYADPYKADIVAAGSVLYTGHWLFRDAAHNRTLRGMVSWLKLKCQTSRIPAKVWGSGFLEYPKIPSGVAIIRPIEVCALRGKISHEILDRLGLCKLSNKIAYGDPGLLYPMLLEEMPEKRFDIGVIPHYFDAEKGRVLFDAIIASGLKAVLIDVMDENPVNTLARIASCSTILSSSLHGCIVSDAMGIPNRHMSLSTLNLSKDDYALKFRDYYSALGIEWTKPFEAGDLYSNLHLLPEKIRLLYGVSLDAVAAAKAALVETFPYAMTRRSNV